MMCLNKSNKSNPDISNPDFYEQSIRYTCSNKLNWCGKSQFCVKSERNKIKLLIPREVILLFSKSCQAAIATFPPLSTAAWLLGHSFSTDMAASLVALVNMCSVLWHSAAILRVWAPWAFLRSCAPPAGALMLRTVWCPHRLVSITNL